MTTLVTAFATDDGKTFMKRHFGDAKFYDIYEISEKEATLIKRIDNTVDEEEEVHADPKKAKGISQLLKKEKVKVVVSKAFGPNIQRIKKKFVCVLMNDVSLEKSISTFQNNLQMIFDEWEKGEVRNHLSLKQN